MHIAATGQSLILAGESTEVDNLAKRATLVKGQGGPVARSTESGSEGPQRHSADDSPGVLVNYELWVSAGSAAPQSARSPVDLYKRTFQGGAPSRPKILDVFA